MRYRRASARLVVQTRQATARMDAAVREAWRTLFERVSTLYTPGRRDVVLLNILAPLLLSGIFYSISYFARDREYFANLSDKAQDSYAVSHADRIEPNVHARPILLIDYDDASAREAGDPLFVPPASIARTLDRLGTTRPWALLIDLDLTYIEDPALLAPLEQAIERLADAGVPVYLARETFRAPYEAPRLRATALDALVNRYPTVNWVGVGVASADDSIARAMPLLTYGRSGTQCRLYPSAPLALYLLDRTGYAGKARTVFASAVKDRGSCDPKVMERPFTVPVGKTNVQIFPEHGFIRYTFRWKSPDTRPRVTVGARSLPQFASVPLQGMLSDTMTIAAERFDGALVILGRTADSSDLHATPYGRMPGSVVIANAARAWIEFGPERPAYWPGLFRVLALTLFLCILAAWILRRYGHRSRLVGILLPGLLGGLLWLCLQIVSSPFASAGIAIASVIIVTLIELSHELVEHRQNCRAAVQGSLT